MGSATADLKMRKGQYTVDGAVQGTWQSQDGAPLRCAQAAVWITENQRQGLAKNHSKVTVLATLTNLFLRRKKLLALVTQEQCVNPLL